MTRLHAVLGTARGFRCKVIWQALSLSQFKKGDRVFGLAPWFWMSFKEGTYAEYVSPKEEWLAYCPKSLPLHVAGQVPVVALTAWQVCSKLRIMGNQQHLLWLC